MVQATGVLKYLLKTKNYGLSFKKSNQDVKLFSSARIFDKVNDPGCAAQLYADADWAGDPKDIICYSGYVFIFAGSAIGWPSHKQKAVGTSSRNAEYISMNDAVKELLFLQGLLGEILGKTKPMTLYSDSQSAIKSLNRGSLDYKNKYIKVRFNEVMQETKLGNVLVKYKCSEDMVADVLTKSLGKVKHARCLEGLGVIDLKL